MNKLGIGLLTTLIASTAFFGLTQSFFSDIETSANNNFTAGRIDLKINGQDNPSSVVSFDDLKPGDDKIFEKDVFIDFNPARVYVHLANLIATQGAQTEPEIVEETANGPKFDIQNYIKYDLKVGEEVLISLDHNVSLPDAVSCWIPLGTIPGDTHVTVEQSFHFDAGVTNWAQGDSLTFTEEFLALQVSDPQIPTTGSGRVWDPGQRKCVQSNITPTPTPSTNIGGITVCKVILDSAGNITNGSDLPGNEFTISGFTPSPETSQGAPAGVLPLTTFTTPLTFNADFFNPTGEGPDGTNDTQCFTYSNLALGHYYYSEETTPLGGWTTPQYNDQVTQSVTTLDDFFFYQSHLFDAQPDEDRNLNADGDINLTPERPQRTLVIKNRRSGLANQCVNGKTWTTSVISSAQGTLNNGNPITDPARTNPNNALGLPNWVPGTGTNFFSLGKNGVITLSFNSPIVNGVGTDLSFHEATNGRPTYPLELSKVEVSANGTTWFNIGNVGSEPAGNGTEELDFFTLSGLSSIQFVRLTDITNFALHDSLADGYDLDAVGGNCEVIQ